MSGSVRVARAGDGALIARVRSVSWDATYRGLLPDAVVDRMMAASRGPVWERAIAAGQTIFVAVESGDVVGFCAVGPPDGPPGATGELTAMYALPSALGRGHGRRMMEHALAWFSDRRYRDAVLWVLDTNRAGRDFYEKAGWRADGTVVEHDLFGDPVPHARYRIDLPASPPAGLPYT